MDKGPVAVTIHVNDAWCSYKQGIFNEKCEGFPIHAVVVVGYGSDPTSGMDYWIVKNQWGTEFGDQGYIKMRRNHGNLCQIASDAVWVV